MAGFKVHSGATARFHKNLPGPCAESIHSDERRQVDDAGRPTNHLPAWTKTILSDKDAAKYISGIGLHWYAATEDILPSALYFGLMNKTHHDFPDFFMLATEACEGFLPWSQGPRLGDWTRAETYAHDIAGDLNNYAIGWTDWNAFLDVKGGPNWAKNECDSPIILDTENKTRFYKQPDCKPFLN